MKYAEWRACERWGIKPWEFDNLSLQQQADILAYEQVCSEEINQAHERASRPKPKMIGR